MKKYLYLSLSILMAFMGGLQAQSLSFVSKDTLVKDTAFPNKLEVNSYAEVKNISSQPVKVIVLRTGQNLASDHKANFCWYTACYAPFTSESTDTIELAPDSVENSFKGTINPKGKGGTSTVTHCFVNAEDLSDSICYTATYEIAGTTTSAKDALIADGAHSVSNAYPNPATDKVYFDYSIGAQAEATIELYDLLGAKVSEFNLNPKSSQLVIHTDNYKPGVYIYSVRVGGQSVGGNKLIIKP